MFPPRRPTPSAPLPRFARAFAWLLVACLALGPAAVAQPAPADTAATAPPPAARDLLRLLDDPAVRAWIERERSAGTAPSAPPPPSPSAQVEERLSAARAHLRSVAAAVPRLPDEARGAVGRLLAELQERGLAEVLALLLALAALGRGTERAFWTATRSLRAWIGERPTATVAGRLRVIGLRLAFGLALVAAFAIGSVGAFLAFEWPPLLRTVVLTLLLAVLAVRLALVLGRVALAPGGHDDPDRHRVVPMRTELARFWQRRLGLFAGAAALAWAVSSLLAPLGFSADGRAAVAYGFGLGLLFLGIEAVWRRPPPEGTDPTDPGVGAPEEAPRREDSPRRRGRTGASALLTAYGVLLWLLWVAELTGLFALAITGVLLPRAIAVVGAAVAHLTRPPEEPGAPSRRGALEVALERGLRAALIVGAALSLAHVWGVDLVALTDRDTLGTRLVRGALASVVVLLLADVLWQVIKAAIDRKLAEAADPAEPGSAEAVRRARLRTLLPIFRNILFAALAVLAGLTALSSLGVEIGPLIAGAGVVGVAVGFGAQTLVKDVISGIFYLLDDAFRIGEYIQSGSHKGTVESFSLRSVKLRHHRGPLTTVPFGQLGAVENMSRDWVIDKFQIGITYDSDIERARKLIKAVGQELKADPELGRHILEPLKMQGVEQFGDYAVQIRCKMMTEPGEQFVIRRKAFARIKQVFDENGIRFAFPTVQVAGGEAEAAAARTALQGAEADQSA